MKIHDGDLTYRVIGAAMQVHTELGPGLREKPYENGLAIELKERGIDYSQQPSFPIFYRDQIVGDCIPDFIVEAEVIVECKSISSIGDTEIGQMLNYLRIAKKKVGLILNFRGAKLEQKRVQL
jgi:GxxExxY protein